jgi:hypothetical protein
MPFDRFPSSKRITYSGFQFEFAGTVVFDQRNADLRGRSQFCGTNFANQKIKREKPFVVVEEIHRDVLRWEERNKPIPRRCDTDSGTPLETTNMATLAVAADVPIVSRHQLRKTSRLKFLATDIALRR